MLSNSGRNSGRLGPGGNLKAGDDSGNSSRTNTPPVKGKQESTSHANAFDALASLNTDDGEKDDAQSPPSVNSSPALTKSKPAVTGESSSLSKSTTVGDEGAPPSSDAAKPSGGS